MHISKFIKCVHFKCVQFIVCYFYPNKAVLKGKKGTFPEVTQHFSGKVGLEPTLVGSWHVLPDSDITDQDDE